MSTNRLAILTAVVLVLCVGASANAGSISFDATAAIGEITPGGTSAWLVVFGIGSHRLTYLQAILEDTDGDGKVRWELRGRTPSAGFYAMADLSDGSTCSHPGVPAHPFSSGMFGRDPSGNYSFLLVPRFGDLVDFLWVRPGVGAWRGTGREGGWSTDFDGVTDNLMFPISEMWQVGTAPVPASVAAGDFILALGTWNFQQYSWLGARVSSEHLAAAPDLANATGEIVFHYSDPNVSEAAGKVALTVRRSGGWNRTASVKYATEDGSATGQYVPASGTLTFAPGEMFRTFEVPLINDTAFAGFGNSFLVNLSNATGSLLGFWKSRLITIDEDDPIPTFTLSNAETIEGTAATMDIAIAGALARPLELRWSSESGGGTITIAPGDTHKRLTFAVWNDKVAMPDRVHNVQLSYNGKVLARATLKVIDDDGAPILTIDDVRASEGDSEILIRVNFTAAAGSATVKYTTSGGTAQAGSDFVPATGTLTLGSSNTIPIRIVDDGLPEDDETFTITLFDPTGAMIARGTATITIADNEIPAVSIEDLIVTEGTPTAALRVRLSYPAKHDALVRAETRQSTATSGTDYVPLTVASAHWIPKGSTETVLPVTLVDDTQIETPEIFEVAVTEASGIRIGRSTAAVSILDDDAWRLNVTAHDLAIVEGNAGTTEAIFTIELSQHSPVPVSVHYATSELTAKASSDYITSQGTLVFEAGEMSKRISIRIQADTQSEPDEQFALGLSTDTTSFPPVICTIVNDDQLPPARRRSTRH